MSSDETVTALFAMAVTAEERCKELYSGLAKRFSHLPDAARFWMGMAMDEVQHHQKLENVRDSLTLQQLHSAADHVMIEKARQALTFSAAESSNSVATLDDAYALARELERSEVNTVFAFVMNEFIPSEKQKDFVLLQLEHHTQKIVKFPETFGDAEWRRSIAAGPMPAGAQSALSRRETMSAPDK
ncbi:MAG: hypothetical protein WCE90_13340 [Candidatus Zixiibacteriota bacterium]